MKALVAQSRAEIMMTLRRGESLLLAIGIPVAALVCFSSLHILDTGPGRSINFLTPGILALAIMSTAMVNVAISTGFERYYGVLKRLGSTPLGRPSLIGAKTVSVLVVEIIQAIVLIVVGLFLGWHPGLQGSAAGAGSGIGIVVILQAIAAAGIAT
ncbi:MAG TPA: ABC transporter permease, partial [Acidimicrobiales bacterium]|nr:ABC transporter permease [Acidimicrobiales bacterium]